MTKPSKDIFERMVDIHPMKQIVYASIIQITMFGFMMSSFYVIGLLFN